MRILHVISSIDPASGGPTRALVELTREFLARYDITKRERGLMDFSDLERLAHRLLTETQEVESQSPVAVQLRQRFSYVLVDEFQDINPLQARIIRQVSRESLDNHPGNLFAVGLMLDKNLGLVLQAAEGGRMDDPVAVTLKRRAVGALLFGMEPPPAGVGPDRKGC